MQKESKKILITGASRGIGKDIALKSKEKGYEVLGTSTTHEGVSNLRENGIHGLQLNLASSCDTPNCSQTIFCTLSSTLIKLSCLENLAFNFDAQVTQV